MLIANSTTDTLAVRGGEPVRRDSFTRWPVHDNRELELMLEVVSSGRWSFDGPREQEFAHSFASYLGATHGFCVANGTVSLEIALKALGIGYGDEVIVPALTWIADASAVLAVGAVPVIVDIDAATWCIDPSAVEAAITTRTRAVIAVHLYGSLADLDQLVDLTRRKRIALVEDCAHTHVSRWRDRAAGSIGEIGSFSFQQSKPLTAGEGGFLVTDDADLAARIFSLKNCGRPWKGKADSKPLLGNNHRLTEFQAAILLAQLERLDEQVATREQNARQLDDELGSIPGIVPQRRPDGVTRQSFYRYAFRIERDQFGGVHRDVFLEALRAEGIPAEPPYLPMVEQPALVLEPRWTPQLADRRQLAKSPAPVARAASDAVVTIPHEVLLGSREDMDDIVAAVAKIQEQADQLRTLKNRLRTLKADWFGKK